jgi:hypothetical protein
MLDFLQLTFYGIPKGIDVTLYDNKGKRRAWLQIAISYKVTGIIDLQEKKLFLRKDRPLKRKNV